MALDKFGLIPGATSLSTTRMSAKTIEVTTGLAEWEVFYGGHWRDVSSDYRWDTTLAGNTILRAIRWDDGFRSYREDRGLVLRRKTRDDTSGAGIDIHDFTDIFASAFGTEGLLSFGKSFGKAALTSIGLSSAASALALGSSQLALAARPVIGAAVIFSGLSLVKDPDKTTGQKVFGLATKAGLSIALAALPSPFKALAIPFAILSSRLVQGEAPGTAIAGTLGSITGGKVGGLVSNAIFPAAPTIAEQVAALRTGPSAKTSAMVRSTLGSKIQVPSGANAIMSNIRGAAPRRGLVDELRPGTMAAATAVSNVRAARSLYVSQPKVTGSSVFNTDVSQGLLGTVKRQRPGGDLLPSKAKSLRSLAELLRLKNR